MPLLVVRHARAGHRRRWDGPDEHRPLSGRGRRQAEALVGPLAAYEPTRLLSSPTVRCAQTLEPLASKLDLPVELTDALAEGGPARAIVALAREQMGSTAVLCSHGEVIPILLDALEREDGLVLPDDYPCAKGSTWVIGERRGRYVDARYLPEQG
jgi:8-oxo-dGTP diphosphatase